MGNNNIDYLIQNVKNISQDDLDEAISIYEKYIEKEEDVSDFIHNLIFTVKNRREKNKLGESGLYICRFEET